MVIQRIARSGLATEPMEPLRWTGFIERMADAAHGLGWDPFPGPAAVNTRTYQERSACMYHGFCNRGGCHVDAKNSTAVTTIPRAEATGNLKVVPHAHVVTIDSDRDGRVIQGWSRGGTAEDALNDLVSRAGLEQSHNN